MAKIFPTIENINRLKVPPTNGEWHLINYLLENLDNDTEIYFQPFLNGDRPDIVLLKKNVGVTIIEIKDWNSEHYFIDKSNNWVLKKNTSILKSPFQQVFNYKENLFNLHINGLLEQKFKKPIINTQFYGVIKVFVYFHNITKQQLINMYQSNLNNLHNQENILNEKKQNQEITFQKYNSEIKKLQNQKKKIHRILNWYSLTSDFSKEKKIDDKYLLLPNHNNNLFTDNIYQEFKRILNPPFHTLNEGIDISYTKEQQKLIKSQPIHQKILGVAGAGKTTILAKRAVNALKRTNSRILILTYNITLKSYIKQKISEVRDDFPWENFYITNYHEFIKSELNNFEIKIYFDENFKKALLYKDEEAKQKEIEEYLEKNYFSNRELFEKIKDKTNKYETILIDEVQDYKPEWIKIIRDYFAVSNSEIVLFGDVKQNVYKREIRKRTPVIVQGFGEWQRLTKLIRYEIFDTSLILPLIKKYQQTFLSEYEIDEIEEKQKILSDDKNKTLFELQFIDNKNTENIVFYIISNIQKLNIHNNDIVILSNKVNILKEIDFILRKNYNFKTITTFETKEFTEKFSLKSTEQKNIRKRKKIGFNQNSGKIKISTIYSYKGYESECIFLFLEPQKDLEEIIYTAITRAKKHLVIFTKNQSDLIKYNNFFKETLNFI